MLAVKQRFIPLPVPPLPTTHPRPRSALLRDGPFPQVVPPAGLSALPAVTPECQIPGGTLHM